MINLKIRHRDLIIHHCNKYWRYKKDFRTVKLKVIAMTILIRYSINNHYNKHNVGHVCIIFHPKKQCYYIRDRYIWTREWRI